MWLPSEEWVACPLVPWHQVPPASMWEGEGRRKEWGLASASDLSSFSQDLELQAASFRSSQLSPPGPQ